jgi:hypothetical protein
MPALSRSWTAAAVGLAIGLGAYYGTRVPRPDATLSGWR